MQTLSEENYLKAIYHLSRQGDVKVSAKAIADHMENNPASIIDMLRKLGEKKLIQYDKTKGARLTEKGLKAALQIVRKHRLWEVFLHQELGYSWHEVHDIAEQLEHIRDDELANRLDQFLGFPDYDPHGDPIPKSDGQLPGTSRTTLAEMEPGKPCQVVAVKDTSTAFLQYLQQLKIGIGTRLQVTEIIPFDGSLAIVIGKNEKATVSKKFADSILVA